MENINGLVYVVDDDASAREGLASFLSAAGLKTHTAASGEEFLAMTRTQLPSCLVLDVNLPGLSGIDLQEELIRCGIEIPIIFLTGHGDIPMTVRALKSGAADFFTKPTNSQQLLVAVRQCIGIPQVVAGFGKGVSHSINEKPRSNQEMNKRHGTDPSVGRNAAMEQHRDVVLREEIAKASIFEDVVGTAPALKRVLEAVIKVAPTDSTVLITGETGTGKELIARAIHMKSKRSTRPFVTVNCAAIPQSLISSELFGHEKGSFTGALQRRAGRFEVAEGGTIFLDEVGELPPETQIALLRVLQEREFQRVGGCQTIRINVRVLAATNRDLRKAVAAGTFRQDLFYRLNVFPMEIPPLRERKEDVPVLVEYFLDRFTRKTGKRIRSVDKSALERLINHAWPGNIRELQNVIERAVIICESETLTVDENWLFQGMAPARTVDGALSRKSAEEERELIEKALMEAEGKVSGSSGAAARLGIAASTLEYKIRLLKINKYQFKRA